MPTPPNDPASPVAAAPVSRLSRVRHETRRRLLEVKGKLALSASYLRLTLTGDLAGFISLGFDDHIKLFLRSADGDAVMRDFTPRRYDAVANELDIDFALHEAGPASDWARSASIGSTIEIGGPRGSMVIEDSFDWYVLVGDETALPAIARRLAELRRGVSTAVVALVDGPADEIDLPTLADLHLTWGHRRAGQSVESVSRDLPRFAGEGFVWIAGEAAMAAAVRRVFVDERHQPRSLIKAAGYWQQGVIGVHQVIEDEGAAPKL